MPESSGRVPAVFSIVGLRQCHGGSGTEASALARLVIARTTDTSA